MAEIFDGIQETRHPEEPAWRASRRTLSIDQPRTGRGNMAEKIAVITGAGSGIGRASAHCLLQDGWTVVLAGRRKHMLEETASLANAPPPRTLAVPTDVSDPA